SIKLENNITGEVTQYRYIFHELKITSGNHIRERQRRIGFGWVAYGKLKNVFNSKIPMSLNRKVINSAIMHKLLTEDQKAKPTTMKRKNR
ncbi:hypothetical protein HUJ04_011397, partial [Dendroctonus ponderosae]